jgi:hypothetical protein
MTYLDMKAVHFGKPTVSIRGSRYSEEETGDSPDL